ncbi:unnamed protein product [Clavelina lepadiformis]|uniref:Caspase family p10 domain-containing protein n=1 Tax=Clavelina lepadiformis TaxID=159417 RepID=A0ABP0GJ08_CLALP
MSSIVRIFSKEAKDEHLLDLMTKVNNEVSHQSRRWSDGSMQLTDTWFSLRKKLYLYPGILHME